jgi:hypothetical protein
LALNSVHSRPYTNAYLRVPASGMPWRRKRWHDSEEWELQNMSRKETPHAFAPAFITLRRKDNNG